MKAAVLHKIGGPFVIEEVELLPPQPNEVRVRLAAAGTCHSDWHFVVGNIQRSRPLVLGHEGAGVVEEVGSRVTRVQPGQRVILNWGAVLRRLLLLPARAEPAVRDLLGLAQRHHARRQHAAAAGRQAGDAVQRAVHLRRADGGSRAVLCAASRRRFLRGGGAGRLRGDHRRGSRPEHGADPPRRERGGVRLRRRRAQRGAGRRGSAAPIRSSPWTPIRRSWRSRASSAPPTACSPGTTPRTRYGHSPRGAAWTSPSRPSARRRCRRPPTMPSAAAARWWW